MATGNRMTVMSLADWAKVDVNEIRERWAKRRKEMEEVEKKKTEREKRIEEAKRRKKEKRKRAIRERRCFVCGIFGYIVCYCRIREEKEELVQVPLNKFEVLKDRGMERGEGSGREVVKDRREILKKEKVKKEKRKIKEKKEKIEEEREIKMQGFSGGEILRGRYSLVW